jgi:hypothetical protein
MRTSNFISELNTNPKAYEILHVLTKNEDFSVYEQMDTNILIMIVLLLILRYL